jgi:hypothetical protein
MGSGKDAKNIGITPWFSAHFLGNGEIVLFHACVLFDVFDLYILCGWGIISLVVYDYMKSLFYHVCLYRTMRIPIDQ